MNIPRGLIKGKKKDLEKKTRELVKGPSKKEGLRKLIKDFFRKENEQDMEESYPLFKKDGESYPKKNIVTKQGYTMTIHFYGIYTRFVYGIAQQGDPKGSISLKGHGVKVSTGNRLIPENLSKGCDSVVRLGNVLVDKYNKEPDWPFLHELGEEVFRPYTSFY